MTPHLLFFVMTKKEIFLDYGTSSHKVILSDEGYQKVLEVVERYRVCSECGDYFTDENMCVAANTCLTCFRKGKAHLTFLGRGLRRGTLAFFFIDKAGVLSYTVAGSGMDDKDREDKELTILYWGFPLPISTQDKQNYELDRASWSIYGDVCNDKMIIVRYNDTYEGLDVAFLAYRGRKKARRFNMRTELCQKLWRDALAEFSETRKGKDVYKAAIYELIARNINAVL